MTNVATLVTFISTMRTNALRSTIGGGGGGSGKKETSVTEFEKKLTPQKLEYNDAQPCSMNIGIHILIVTKISLQ